MHFWLYVFRQVTLFSFSESKLKKVVEEAENVWVTVYAMYEQMEGMTVKSRHLILLHIHTLPIATVPIPPVTGRSILLIHCKLLKYSDAISYL